MKSERRHELEHNELADRLAKGIEAVKPYQNLILGIVVLLVVAGGVYFWLRRASASQTDEAWDLYGKALSDSRALAAGDFSRLNDVIEKYPKTRGTSPPSRAADFHLDIGCNLLFQSKAYASQELYKARELYEKVRQESRNDALLEQATFGRPAPARPTANCPMHSRHTKRRPRSGLRGPLRLRRPRAPSG